MSSNLPPGVTESMLPGNRPEDVAFDVLCDKISEDLDKHDISEEVAFDVWAAGLEACGYGKDA